MKPVKDFLKANGFSEVEDNRFNKMDCCVTILDSNYSVDCAGGTTYSPDLQIYWLVGFLTWYGYVDKEFNKLPKQAQEGLEKLGEKVGKKEWEDILDDFTSDKDTRYDWNTADFVMYLEKHYPPPHPPP